MFQSALSVLIVWLFGWFGLGLFVCLFVYLTDPQCRYTTYFLLFYACPLCPNVCLSVSVNILVIFVCLFALSYLGLSVFVLYYFIGL